MTFVDLDAGKFFPTLEKKLSTRSLSRQLSIYEEALGKLLTPEFLEMYGNEILKVLSESEVTPKVERLLLNIPTESK